MCNISVEFLGMARELSENDIETRLQTRLNRLYGEEAFWFLRHQVVKVSDPQENITGLRRCEEKIELVGGLLRHYRQ